MWYCGVASYTQAIPSGIIMEPVKLSASACAEMAHTRKYQTASGVWRKVEVPGHTSHQITVAGVEHFEAGIMRCQGEDHRVGDRLLRDVVIIHNDVVEIQKEKYVETSAGIVESTTSRVALTCPRSSGGCEGLKQTFIWLQTKAGCTYALVNTLKGRWDESETLYVAENSLATFNMSEGVLALPRQCSEERISLRRTQFPRLFLYGGDQPLRLKTVSRDVELQLQVEVLEDTVARLQYQVEDAAGASASQAECFRQYHKLGGAYQRTREEGVYLLQAGEAILKIACSSIILPVRETKKCFDALPIHHGVFHYVDLQTKLAVTHAAEIPCSPVRTLYFASTTGEWWRYTPLYLPSSAPMIQHFDHDGLRPHPLNRHLSIYTAQEIMEYHNLQLVPGVRSQMQTKLWDGLCSGDTSCPLTRSGSSTPYSFSGLEAKIESSVDSLTGGFFSKMGIAWETIQLLSTIGGFLSFCTAVVLALVLVGWGLLKVSPVAAICRRTPPPPPAQETVLPLMNQLAILPPVARPAPPPLADLAF